MAAPLLALDHVRNAHTRGHVVAVDLHVKADLVIDRPSIVGRGRPERRRQDHAVRDDDRSPNAPSSGHVYVAGTDIHRVKYRERDRLAIHYHPQTDQVLVPGNWCRRLVSAIAVDTSPMVTSPFDEPQFNLQDGYIGLTPDFFRKLRAEGRLVVLCLHPTAAWHLEILAEIAEQYLLVADGGVTRQESFVVLTGQGVSGMISARNMTRAAEALRLAARRRATESIPPITSRDISWPIPTRSYSSTASGVQPVEARPSPCSTRRPRKR